MRLKECEGLVVNEEFVEVLTSNGLCSFNALMGYAGGESVKVKKERSVVRLELGHGDGDGKKAFYLKRHFNERGSSPRGGLRSILSWKGPEDARNEWEKMILLTELNIPTMAPVAFGEAGTRGEAGGKEGPPGALTLTEGLEGVVKFDDYLLELDFSRAGMEGVRKKRALIGEIARLARRFHAGGLNHQDFYLVHFLIRPGQMADTGEIFLADLQRVQRRSVTKGGRTSVSRWVVKDLGQFAFSALAAQNFTHADLMRFAHAYLGRGTLDREDKKLIKRVLAKARRVATHDAKLRERRGAKSL